MSCAKYFSIVLVDETKHVEDVDQFDITGKCGQDLTRWLQTKYSINRPGLGTVDSIDEMISLNDVSLSVYLLDVKRALNLRENLSALVTLAYDEAEEELEESGGDTLYFMAKLEKRKILFTLISEKLFSKLRRKLKPPAPPSGPKPPVDVPKQEKKKQPKPLSDAEKGQTPVSQPLIRSRKSESKENVVAPPIVTPNRGLSLNIEERLNALEVFVKYQTQPYIIESTPMELGQQIESAYLLYMARHVIVDLNDYEKLHQWTTPVVVPSGCRLEFRGSQAMSTIQIECRKFLTLSAYSHVDINGMKFQDQSKDADTKPKSSVSCLVYVNGPFASISLSRCRFHFGTDAAFYIPSTCRPCQIALGERINFSSCHSSRTTYAVNQGAPVMLCGEWEAVGLSTTVEWPRDHTSGTTPSGASPTATLQPTRYSEPTEQRHLSKKDQFEQNLNSALRARFSGSSRAVASSKPGGTSVPPGETTGEIKDWSIQQVEKWLKDTNLGSLVTSFHAQCADGRILVMIHQAQRSSSLPQWIRALPSTHRKRLIKNVTVLFSNGYSEVEEASDGNTADTSHKEKVEDTAADQPAVLKRAVIPRRKRRLPSRSQIKPFNSPEKSPAEDSSPEDEGLSSGKTGFRKILRAFRNK